MAESDAELDEELDPGPDDVENEDDAPDDLDSEDPDAVDDEDLEAADEDLEEPPRQPQRQSSRKPANQTIAQLRADRRKEREENQQLRERLARLEGNVEVVSRRPSGPTEAERQAEAERIAAMSPQEYADYKLGEERKLISQALTQDRVRNDNTLDAIRFERLCERNTAYASVQDEVERRHAEMLRQGFTAERKRIANDILGERAAAKAAKTAGQRQRTNADARRRQETRPPRAGSDVSEERTTRGRKNETAKEKLARLDVRF